MVDLRVLLEANEFLRAENRRRQELVGVREAKARAHLADCESERREWAAEMETIEAADQLYRRRIAPQLPSGDDEDQPRLAVAPQLEAPIRQQARARIGPQRYFILSCLRGSHQFVPVEAIADQTRLSIKRVRDQLRSDVSDGFIVEAHGVYGIRASGLALMDKYETYKRSKGEPLPSLDDPPGEDDVDDPDVDQASDGHHEENVIMP